MTLTHRDVATVGVGGPVGSGKTSLIAGVVPRLREEGLSVGVVANDAHTREDAETLRERLAGVVPEDLVAGVETGGSPDSGGNSRAVSALLERHPDLDIVLIESGGEEGAFDPALTDYHVYVISVAEGDDVPRKRGAGVVEADLLVINKTDLAPHVGADLDTMARDARSVREGPHVLTDCRNGEGIDAVVNHVRSAVLFA